MKVLIAVLAALALGAGVYVLTRPSADVDHVMSYGTRGWGGAHATEPRGTAPLNHYAGTGTVVAVVWAHNLRDHAVKLGVPEKTRAELGRFGIRAEVRFIPMSRRPDYERESDLARGATAMPAHAEGDLLHIFHVDRCLPPNSTLPAPLEIEVDGHPARTEVSVTSDRQELWTYERDVRGSFGTLEIGRC